MRAGSTFQLEEMTSPKEKSILVPSPVLESSADFYFGTGISFTRRVYYLLRAKLLPELHRLSVNDFLERMKDCKQITLLNVDTPGDVRFVTCKEKDFDDLLKRARKKTNNYRVFHFNDNEYVYHLNKDTNCSLQGKIFFFLI